MFVFVHNEKTAGTSFKFILRNSFGLSQCDANYIKRNPFTDKDLRFARKVFFSLKSITGHNIVEPTKHMTGDDLKFMTFLREPIMRCISNYQDNCIRGGMSLPLEEWILIDKNQNVQVKRIAGEENAEKAKSLLKERYFFVGLTERFEESMKLLKVISPYSLNLKYKKQVVARDNTIKKEILNDPSKMDLLKKYNQLDTELYDYVSKELFPNSLEKHIDEVSAIEFSKKQYRTDYIWKYRNSIVFNKFVYKTILKLLRKRG